MTGVMEEQLITPAITLALMPLIRALEDAGMTDAQINIWNMREDSRIARQVKIVGRKMPTGLINIQIVKELDDGKDATVTS